MLPVPHSRSINSNFEVDVLETQAKLGKMLMIFVISVSKLTKTARSDEEVREAYSDSLLVRMPSRTNVCEGGIEPLISSGHAVRLCSWLTY